MNETLPATLPSLARAFEPERARLHETLSDPDLSSAEIVTVARRALDSCGTRFAKDVHDPHLHKVGLWLLEMVKAGAGILDRGTGAEVIWRETPKPKTRQYAGSTLFYGAAGVFAVMGVLQTAPMLIIAAGVLAALRFFDPKDWTHLKYKIPFVKRPMALEDNRGHLMTAEARITADVGGFIDSLADALRTADHILLRLAEPARETHWRQDARLMGLVQGLLEAGRAEDGDFALKLIQQELESVLNAEGVELIEYSKKNESYFDVLPAMGEGGTRVVAPALMSGDELIKRGTVWAGDE